MAISKEVETTPALKERASAIVREAVKRVPVCEYLQLKYRSKKRDFNEVEYKQISDGVGAIISQAAKLGKRTYDPSDKIEFSADPRIIGARLILTKMPLPEYLAVRQTVLEEAIERNTRRLQHFETLVGYETEAEKTSFRVGNLLNDYNLTNRVIIAAKISLT